jgi:predicted ATPase
MTEVFEQADGVPLFVEELTKAVLETVDRNGQTAALAAAPPAMLAVPATLNASLIARLDRVGPSGKEIAQVGAVLGREFGQAPTEPALVITVSQRAGRPPGGPYRTRAGGFSGP